MTQEQIERAHRIYALFLNERGTGRLGDHMVMKELITNLSDQDVTDIEQAQIYFNPVPSPAASNRVNKDLPAGAHIVTVDINCIDHYTAREIVAMILHEIGHVFKPSLRDMEGEFAADEYAIQKGFAADILSSLEKAIQIDPTHFNNSSTNQRIEKLNQENG
jgi:Cdc6-like AAA superfamily ATPase